MENTEGEEGLVGGWEVEIIRSLGYVKFETSIRYPGGDVEYAAGYICLEFRDRTRMEV